MSAEPRVSVIMAVYDAEKYLREAVESVVAQTLKDCELIVVDDASTDASLAILQSYADPRIRLLRNPTNLGQCVSRNRALAAAQGRYIAVLDADDVALPTRLEKQAQWLDGHPEVGVLGSDAIIIDEEGKERGLWHCAHNDDVDLKWQILFNNPFIHSSVMLRKSVLDQTGGYSNEEGIRRSFVEDYELLSRITRCAQSAVVPEILLKYRVHSHGASSRIRAEQQRGVGYVARRNIGWILGSACRKDEAESVGRLSCGDGRDRQLAPEPILDYVALMRLSQFLLRPPGEDPDLEWEEVRHTMLLLKTLHAVFCVKYKVPRRLALRHRRNTYSLWARHACALALRRKGQRDLRCRLELLVAGLKLLGDAGFLAVS